MKRKGTKIVDTYFRAQITLNQLLIDNFRNRG